MKRSYGVLFYAGAGALALAMFTDSLAVVGRHLGMPVLGAIELIQAAILVASATAMVSATLAGTHARVRLLLDRLAPPRRRALTRLDALLSAAFFAALAAGSVWIAHDLWNGYEQSEVLGLPYRPLRLITIGVTAFLALLFLRQAVTGREDGPPSENGEHDSSAAGSS